MIDKIIQNLIANRGFIYSVFIAITAVTLFITLMPADQITNHRLFRYDKAGHFLLFFSWTLSFGLIMLSKKKNRANILIIVVAGCLFGFSIEFLQYVMPFGRGFEEYDVIADFLGSMAAGLTLGWLRSKL